MSLFPQMACITRNLPLIGLMAASLWVTIFYTPTTPKATIQDAVAAEAAKPFIIERTGEPRRFRASKLSQGIVTLADPSVAGRVGISSSHEEEIKRIDDSLDRAACRLMEAAILQWRKAGGFHKAALPNFQAYGTPHARTLQAMKREAEQKMESVLSDEEKARWLDSRIPLPSKATPEGVLVPRPVASPTVQ